jgi:organic hydroperoxide reductase OsmC/OhrA
MKIVLAALDNSLAVNPVLEDFRFPVTVRWQGQQRARVTAPELDEIDVTVPPEFRGPSGYWSPEHLLVAAAARGLM